MPRRHAFYVVVAVLFIASCTAQHPIAPSEPPASPPLPAATSPISISTATFNPDCPENVPSDPPWICRKGLVTSEPCPPGSSHPPGQRGLCARNTPTLEPTLPILPSGALVLPHAGSLLAYMKSSPPGSTLVLFDPVSNARFELVLPTEAITASDPLSGLSPHARYFAYFKGGSLRSETDILDSVSSEFSLNILDLTTLSTPYVIPLTAGDLQGSLAALAHELASDPYFAGFTPDQIVFEAKDALLTGIRSLAWSPDGSVLAFATQNPGPSSDMYFFYPTSKASRRASFEPGHVSRMYWAPDSSSIVLITVPYYRHGTDETTAIVSRSGELETTTAWGYFLDWANSQWILTSSAVDYGDGFSNLTAIRTSDGRAVTLWRETFADYAVSTDLSSLLVARTDVPSDETTPTGLIRTAPGSLTPQLISSDSSWITSYWGSDRFPFVASSPGAGTIAVPIGTPPVPIDPLPWQIAPSPDATQLALLGNGRFGYFNDMPGPNGLRIVDEAAHQSASVTDLPVDCARWSPDSAGLAYQADGQLYYWDAASSDLIKVDDTTGNWCHFIWTLP